MKNRKCLLVGGPRDGEFRSLYSFYEDGRVVEAKSLAHVGPPMGVYTFNSTIENGLEIWTWKEHKPK